MHGWMDGRLITRNVEQKKQKKDIPSIARHLALLPKKNTARSRVAIITQGTEPTVVATASGDGKDAEIKEFPVRKIGENEINDTNGAGYDIAFH